MDGTLPPAGSSPEALLARFRDGGDPDALGALFDATAPALFRMALRLAPDPGAAEDALQETFLALFQAARGWDASKPAVPWLAGILRHRVQRSRRDLGRRPDFTRLPPPLEVPDPSAGAEAAERTERVRSAILALDEPYRSVALLRWRYGLEPAEIAEVRGEPPGTVWSTLSRAKEKLREALSGAPALLAVLGFPPGMGAGLGEVRGVLMEKARAALPARAAVAAVAGGVLVTKKAMAIAAAAILALLGTWLTARLSSTDIRGRVVDAATGEPIPGARILGFGKDAIVAGDDGTFAIQPGPGQILSVRADAEGFAGSLRTARSGDRLEIVLDRGNTVRGRVVSPAGNPVAGAEVRIEDRNGNVLERRGTLSGPDGTFVCTGVGREGIRVAFVRAEGYGRLVKDFAADNGGPGEVDLGDLVVPVARRLEGLFLTKAGEPIGKAPVQLLGPLEQERACRLRVSWLNTCTDEEGRYRFTGLGPGRYRVSHQAYGEDRRWPEASREVELLPGADLLDADIRLVHGGAVRVRVVDPAGTPLAGVAVVETGTTGLTATTDAEGLAVLANLPDGEILEVDLRWGGAWVEVEGPDAVPADGREVRFVALPAAEIRGVVVDEGGDPVPRAGVSFVNRDFKASPRWMRMGSMSGDDGSFTLYAAEGEEVGIEARRNPASAAQPGDEQMVGRVAEIRAPASRVLIRCRTVKATGSVVLRVVDASGLPVAGLDILAAGGGAGGRPLRTDPDGRAVLGGVFADESLFWFTLPERAPGAAWPLPNGEAPPEPVRAVADGREVLLRCRPGRRLEGVVVDPEGAPVEGASVICPTDRVSTGSDGRFSLVVGDAETVRFVLARRGEGESGIGAVMEELPPGSGPLRLVLDGSSARK